MRKGVLRYAIVAIFSFLALGFFVGCNEDRYSTETASIEKTSQSDGSSDKTEYSTEPVSNYITYTLESLNENFCKIYFEDTCILNTATYEIGSTCKITGCEFSFDFGETTFILADEMPLEFEIGEENDKGYSLKFKKKSPIYTTTLTLECTETITNPNANNYDVSSYIEFYSDNSACLFVNINNIYFPFQTYSSWEKEENIIKIDYFGEILSFEVREANLSKNP